MGTVNASNNGTNQMFVKNAGAMPSNNMSFAHGGNYTNKASGGNMNANSFNAANISGFNPSFTGGQGNSGSGSMNNFAMQRNASQMNMGNNGNMKQVQPVKNNESRMSRYETNYAADKAMLARSETKSISSGNSGKGIINEDDGNVVSYVTDEVVDEIKRRMKE